MTDNTQPEALRLANSIIWMDAFTDFQRDELDKAAAELRRLHAYCQELESQVIRDCMTHVQKPADTNTASGAADSDDALMARELYESQDDSLLLCASDLQHSAIYDNHAEMQSCMRAVAVRITALASAPAQPCPTCAALARTVMLDQVSFDRKPDCYGIRQITEDEGVEEWEDIRTSPDVAREEANDMMATGRGELYEVVPLWTTPQPSTTAQAAESVPAGPRRKDMLWSTAKMQERHDQRIENIVSGLERIKQEHAGQQPQKIDECYGDCPTDSTTCTNPCRFDGRAARAPADSVLEDAALSGEEQRAIFEAYESAASESYFEARPQIDCNDRRRVFKAGYERGWDAARKQGANHD